MQPPGEQRGAESTGGLPVHAWKRQLGGGPSLRLSDLVLGWGGACESVGGQFTENEACCQGLGPAFQPCASRSCSAFVLKPPLTLNIARPVGGQAAAAQAGPGACGQAAGPPVLNLFGSTRRHGAEVSFAGDEVTSWAVTSYLPQAWGQPAGGLGTVIWECLLCPRNRLPQPVPGPGFWWR